MAIFHAIVPADSPLLHALRLFFGSAMALSIVFGTLAIRRRDVAQHQTWMRHAYAIGLGAGTQALTQLPLLLLFGAPNEMTLALMMGAAWLVNLAVDLPDFLGPIVSGKIALDPKGRADEEEPIH